VALSSLFSNVVCACVVLLSLMREVARKA